LSQVTKKQKLSVSIVVPVFNEFKTIETALMELAQYTLNNREAQVIVIESGSTDGTQEITRRFENEICPKLKSSFIFIYEGSPNGKGSACRLGISQSSKETIAIFDADLEYSIFDLDYLVEQRIYSGSKIILGSRHRLSQPMRTFNQSKVRSLYFNVGHTLITTYFNLLFQTNLKDPATMWKVVDGPLARSIQFRSSKFDFDWELLCAFIKRGYVPKELEISYNSRSPNDGKKIRPFRDPVHWILRIAYFRFKRVT
jgi:glycosyltransferase involved in cell wall biosynthesis